MTAITTPPPTNKPAATTPRPTAAPDALNADRIIDDLFITPKVLDRRGFEDMAAVLRQLIRDAAAKGETLKSAAAEVRAMGENLREVTRQLQLRLEAALKVAPALDQRVAKAEQVVQLAIDRNALTEQLEKSISQIIDSRLSEYSRRLDELGQRQEETLKSAASRLAEDINAHRARLTSEATETRGQVEETRSRLVSELDSFQQMVRSQLESASERLSEPVRLADRRASELASRLDGELEAAQDRLRSARQDADVKVAGLVETISRHAELVARRAADAAGTADLQLRDLIDQAAARAETLRAQLESRVSDAAVRIQEHAESSQRRFTDELHQATRAAVEHATRELSEHVQQLQASAATKLGDLIDARSAELQAKAAEIHAAADAAARNIDRSESVATEGAMRAGSQVAAQLVDLGTSTLKAMKETQDQVHKAASEAVANIQQRAGDIEARIEPARLLLDNLPSVITQQLGAFQNRLADMIAPTARKLDELCAAAARAAANPPARKGSLDDYTT